jgi:2-keto-4-pentenoate hydratase/2-oxohepta-3-ene-1,7-dioic acid hydratase in catechol pathway
MNSVSIHSTSLTVGKILCLGRNYAEHAREMQSEIPTTPVVFLKPATALIADGQPILLPRMSNDVHHDVELVVAIGKEG